ncbi:MAG TPA: TadE/TadG family type IV pilus assembly protein [Micropepsaceae bacterium]|nr:TadE/TadG family type IV pilus assembly protein [Micropepsaceae bacterium]
MRRLLAGLSRKEKSGSAAIEFAMVAPIFFLLTFAILETSLVFFADMILDNAVIDTSRLIRTGQAQNQNVTQDQFRTDVCNEVKVMLSCDPAKLLIDVRSFTNFGTTNFPPALDANGNLNPNLNAYQPGGSSQGGGNAIVSVRVMYVWQLYTPLFAQYFENMGKGSGQRLIGFSAAFKNEPY